MNKWWRRMLIDAFHYDQEARISQFVAKVAALPTNLLDETIILEGSRREIKDHLEKVSGDSDFFVGADPWNVHHYVYHIHFKQKL